MSITYKVAAPDVAELANKVIHSFAHFAPIRQHEPTIEYLMAYSESGPAVKHGGNPALAKIKIVSGEERSRGGPDLRVKIDAAKYHDMNDQGRRALLAHELYHIDFLLDGEGHLKKDDYDRPRVKLIPDDWAITGFRQVAEWFGEDSHEHRSYCALRDTLSQGVFGFVKEDHDESEPDTVPLRRASGA